MEQWKPIPEYEGRYEVSNLGAVRSVNVGRWKNRSALLSPGKGNHGYLVVNIAKAGGKSQPTLVHRLVASAFLGECPPGQQVRHRDGVRTNAKLSNLEYGTQADNEKDKVRHGTSRASECYLSKLSSEIVAAIRGAGRLDGVSDSSIAKCLGVSPATMCDIRKVRSWKQVPPMPKKQGIKILLTLMET